MQTFSEISNFSKGEKFETRWGSFQFQEVSESEAGDKVATLFSALNQASSVDIDTILAFLEAGSVRIENPYLEEGEKDELQEFILENHSEEDLTEYDLPVFEDYRVRKFFFCYADGSYVWASANGRIEAQTEHWLDGDVSGSLVISSIREDWNFKKTGKTPEELEALKPAYSKRAEAIRESLSLWSGDEYLWNGNE